MVVIQDFRRLTLRRSLGRLRYCFVWIITVRIGIRITDRDFVIQEIQNFDNGRTTLTGKQEF